MLANVVRYYEEFDLVRHARADLPGDRGNFRRSRRRLGPVGTGNRRPKEADAAIAAQRKSDPFLPWEVQYGENLAHRSLSLPRVFARRPGNDQGQSTRSF